MEAIKKMQKQGKALPDEIKEQIYHQLLHGKSYRQLQRIYNVSLSTIARIKKEKGKFFSVKPRPRKPITRRTRKKIGNAVVTANFIKQSDLIINNILDVGKSIIYGAEKVVDIAENSKKRVNDIVAELEKLNKAVEKHIKFQDGKTGVTERKELVKEIYKVIGLVSSYYSSNKLVIDAVKELRGNAEAYAKLKIEADIISSLNTFTNSIFDGADLLSDEEYIKFRDCVIENSELGKQLFKKYDKTIPI